MMTDKKLPMRRRLRFSLLVLVSQILLIALAISWLVHMVTIAISGSVYFVENNHLILWSEITISIFMILFAIYVLIVQIQRLSERRGNDRSGSGPPVNR